ncbi:hypothetical protein JOD97_003845 [Duganella sp. 1411]|uniref:AAA family ATPase n=1 Tax=Duganella sp. 1411 TaxID=2806572 RepID=UPI001AEA6AFA|nr:AAA family ATPase [Duganella sp. 1411]MBP1205783.1 hypothetical protein [Duganella sp. 1411]
MPTLDIHNFAQITDAKIKFGDLTILVGPQATGKSLVLQLLKFAIDRPVIARHLRENGVDWDRTKKFGLLSAYLGEGYLDTFGNSTNILWDGKSLLSDKSQRTALRDPSVFFVPAQRVMTMAGGWPRPFSSFEGGDPYVVRQFSQNVLEQFSRGVGRNGATIFPQTDRLKAPIRNSIENSIFHGGQLLLNSAGGRKRLVIRYPGHTKGTSVELPFLEWSAGQREFAPLLLGLYQLLPAGKVSAHQAYKWAVIEEPEMGLHPFAINSVMLLAFELMHRGYKVCISTHSPYVLELIWAIKTLQKSKSPRRLKAVLEALNIDSPVLKPMATSLLGKSIQAYAMTYEQFKHKCTDISAFDINSNDPVAAGWGGITNLSALVSRAVARGL